LDDDEQRSLTQQLVLSSNFWLSLSDPTVASSSGISVKIGSLLDGGSMITRDDWKVGTLAVNFDFVEPSGRAGDAL
jgi:hypothetical protein